MKKVYYLSLFVLTIFLFSTCSKDEPIVQYSITTSVSPSEGGSISPSSGIHNEGETITLKASPSAEYVFKNWSGAATGTNNPTTVVMNSNKSVSAVFEKKNYPLIVEIEGQGEVKDELSSSNPSGDYSSGSEIKLTAVPEDGWKFIQWVGDLNSLENPIQITINNPITIKAIFEIDQNTDQYTLSNNTFIIDESDWNEYVIDVDTTNFTFNFKEGLDNKFKPEIGDIFVGQEDGGYLRKITNINTNNDNSVTFETEFTTISEAFESIHDQKVVPLTPNYDSDEIWLAEGVSILQAKNSSNTNSTATKVGFTINTVIYDKDNNDKTTSDQVRVSGGFSLSGDIDTKIDMDFNSIDYLKLEYIFTEEFNINGYLGDGIELQREKIVAHIPCGQYIVGGVTIEPILEVKVGFDAGLKTGIEMGFFQQYTNTTSINYNGNDWSFTNNTDNYEEFTKPEIIGAFNAKLYMKGDIKFKVYKVVSPYVELELSGKAKADISTSSDDLHWETLFGLKLKAGVKAKIWKATLFDFYQEIINWENVFEEGDISLVSGKTYVPDDNFEQALIDKGYDDVLDNYVLTANIENITQLDLHNLNISNATGIEDFTSLKSLALDDNFLTMIDVTNNIELKFLSLFKNDLSSINLSKNTSLKFLDLADNKISSMDVSKNVLLDHLDIANNRLSSIDVTNNTLLKGLYLSGNQISSINVTKNTSLGYLYLRENQLVSIDVSNNVLLEGLYLNNNQFSSIDITKNLLLEEFEIYSNPLSSIDVTKNLQLTRLYAYSNQLNSIDVSNNTSLESLDVYENNLSSLDITQNSKLLYLNIFENQLSSIDISKNLKLKHLNAQSNQLSSIDLTNNVLLDGLFLENNSLTSLDVSKNVLLMNLWIHDNPISCVQVNQSQLNDTSKNWSKDDSTSFALNCSNPSGTGTFTDSRDGKVYKWVKIGEQIWMAENFNYNGTCYNSSNSNCALYGGLYDKNSAINNAPEGWHLPSDIEWKTLEMELGMTEAESNETGWRGTDQGTQMKQGGTSGLEVLFGGYYYPGTSLFRGLGTEATFWTSTGTYSRRLSNSESGILRSRVFNTIEINRFSVRYVKD